MKTPSILLFALAALAQWAAPLVQIANYERTISDGTLVRIKCGAPDPYDPLRGRYLAVRPEQDSVTASNEAKPGKIYGQFSIGPDGLATITSLSESPPAEPYITLSANYHFKGKQQISWPFDRFYLNEELAPEADVWASEALRSVKGITAEVRVLKGRAVLVDLTVEGKSFRQILKERTGAK